MYTLFIESAKAECAEIVQRFKAPAQSDHGACLAAPEAALTGVLPKLMPEEVGYVQRVTAQNHRTNCYNGLRSDQS